MTQRIRVFLGAEVVVFAIASAVHFGVVSSDQRDVGAAIAEGVIAAVLLAGLIVAVLRPGVARAAGIATQGFALFFTCIGFSLVLFVGPTKGLDVAFHLIMLPLLITGLVTTIGLARDERTTPNALGDTA